MVSNRTPVPRRGNAEVNIFRISTNLDPYAFYWIHSLYRTFPFSRFYNCDEPLDYPSPLRARCSVSPCHHCSQKEDPRCLGPLDYHPCQWYSLGGWENLHSCVASTTSYCVVATPRDNDKATNGRLANVTDPIGNIAIKFRDTKVPCMHTRGSS